MNNLSLPNCQSEVKYEDKKSTGLRHPGKQQAEAIISSYNYNMAMAPPCSPLDGHCTVHEPHGGYLLSLLL